MQKGRYDRARRKQARRNGAERGCWVFVPAAELEKAGVDPYAAEPPYYRVWGAKRGGLVGRFYREP